MRAPSSTSPELSWILFLRILDEHEEIEAEEAEAVGVRSGRRSPHRTAGASAPTPWERCGWSCPIALANLVLHGIDHPHIWHGNTLTGQEVYGGLFEGAPTSSTSSA